MTLLLSDPLVRAVPVRESHEPLVPLPSALSPTRALVRTGVAARLLVADALLPDGWRLRVVEGHRSVEDQHAIIARYTAEVCAAHPGVGPVELEHLVARFVSPVEVAPHVSGSAVDLTLVDARGVELDLGTPIDATPEASGGRCWTDSPDLAHEQRLHRDVLVAALGTVGLVNYPTEWWHWSWGDRYWAVVTGADAALHGPVDAADSEVAA